MAGIDENTLFLLNGETLTDTSFYNIPITNNGVQISTSQKKFGTSSMYFNGNSYLTTPAWAINGNEFTIDWWEFVTGPQGARVCTQYSSTTPLFGGVLVTYQDGKSYISSVINNWDIAVGANIVDNVLNQWIHRAIVKTATQILAFKNGQLFWSINNSKKIYYDSNNLSGIGIYYQVGDSPYQGYIDEFRVSNIARWASNFIPPIEPYSSFNVFTKVDNSWQQAKEIYGKINNVWQPVTEIYTKTNNTW